jgi:ribosomal protein S8E
MENLLEYESQRKKEISENRKKYGNYTQEERAKRKEERPVFHCKQCGKVITGRGKVFCSIDCMTEFQREESGTEIATVIEKAKSCTTLVELAKCFNLTDNGIKKRLKTAGKLQEVKDILMKNKKNRS